MTTLTQCQQQVLDMLISYQKERGPANQSGGGNHAGIPFGECSGGASSCAGEKGVTIKRGVAGG